MRVTARALIFFALLTALFSFLKFQPCATIGWDQPGTDIHACYTDISALYYERGLDSDKWPFSGALEKVVEYPVLQGVAMWSVAKISSTIHSYYYITIALIALLFIASTLIMKRISPHNAYLFAAAPVAIAALYINWDMWAIITMLLAIYWFDNKKYQASAIALGVSIATKFFPIVLLIAVIAYFIRTNEVRKSISYSALTLTTYGLINLPFALSTPQGWWRFFELNLHRNPDWGSLWLGLEFSNVHLSHFNFLTLLTTLIPLIVAFFYLLNTREVLTLAQSSIFFIAIIMTFGKVYSPQYVLWLLPLVVIAMRNTSPAYWAWQITEIIYHLAIWLHLAGLAGDKVLIPQSFYTAAIFIRIAGVVVLVVSLARQHRLSPNFPREFLFKTGEIYP